VGVSRDPVAVAGGGCNTGLMGSSGSTISGVSISTSAVELPTTIWANGSAKTSGVIPGSA
jgi:hypothetical protein